MIFFIYDADYKLRFKSANWPMARAALDVVIFEGSKDGRCPRLVIVPELEGEKEDR